MSYLIRTSLGAAATTAAVLFFSFGQIRASRADPVAELSAFSVFNNVDLAQLAHSDAKTARGPAMSSPRYLSVQSVYVAPGSPAKAMAALRSWDPTRHSEMKVFLHADIPGTPGAATFAKLRSAPDNSAVRSLVNATLKMSPELQFGKDDAKKFVPAAGVAAAGGMPPAVAGFWTDQLLSRSQAFLSGGSAAQPPYAHTGESVRPADEFNGLLRQQDKVRRQFSGFLESTGIGRGAGSKPELYWELLEADDQGVLTLGAFYSRAGSSGTYQAADALYYASGGYYVALTLYQMWSVEVEGKPATLVWRGDMISAASLGSLHGVERLASESAMMKDISRAITFFRRDTSGGR